MTWESNANRPTMDDNLQYHIRCKKGDVNRYVLLPGDPARADMIAREWRDARFISSNREHRTHSGYLPPLNQNGQPIPVTCCSTGMGGGSTSIAMEELGALGADTFIRVGTCGAFSASVECGDLIICSGAMRQDGTSPDYVDISYPAMAHYEVTAALVAACERLGVAYHVGVSCSTASFYCGQARPGLGGYGQSMHDNKIDDLERAGVLDFEMEAATVFTLAGIYGFRAGAVLSVVAHRRKNEFKYEGIDRSVGAANESIRILADMDERRVAKNKKYWYPGL
ncbi:uridine phosphorylase [Synergistales bacterium]|nr:uridine phosphorylase [Synergistales bacterium]